MSETLHTKDESVKTRAQYAGLSLRAIAMVVDLSIVLGIVAIVELLVQVTGLMFPTATHLIAVAGLSVLTAVGYFTAFESSSWRSTPGKRWMGLRVTDLTGKRVTKKKALVRTLLNLAGVMALGLHNLTAIGHRKVQTWPDKLTDVVVLQKPAKSSTQRETFAERMIPAAACAGMAAVLAVGLQTKEVQQAVPALYEPPLAKMALDLMERSSPLREYVLAELISNGKVPTDIPADLAKTLPQGKLGGVAYDRKSGNIIISMRTSERKATIALSPIARGQGQWRWACGLVGIKPDEVPASCRRD